MEDTKVENENAENIENETVKEIIVDDNIKKEVTVRSIAPWETGAKRILSFGDITLQKNGFLLIPREEIIAQAQSGNKLLTGTKGFGEHATWYIEDAFTRKKLSFDTDETEQSMLSEDEIKKIFDIKSSKAFETKLKSCIVTRAEKYFLMDMIKKLKINDYQKIVTCEEHAKMKL